MKAVARMRSCPMSARKMRLVADLVRGKNIDDALNILHFHKKEASNVAEKVLLSAIANWEYKTDMTENADDFDLVISEITVDEAGMLKRFRPRAYGRAHPIRKRSCHLNITVENRLPIPMEMEDEAEEEYYEEEYIEEEEFEEEEEYAEEEGEMVEEEESGEEKSE